ncbi:MAG: caspase family protein [Bosea sp.]|uniref:caspase family protein n=1 Tax=Bosea sp. (in: a-proteobacteria) TaxID=1871050 RepID=UPI001AC510BA|nr:caspase family protein [Bosea sp. (in: a-proteobacteria)]MBN9468153.1 caspase family protein [Bosea sp. (in: a-proteobacteria)]
MNITFKLCALAALLLQTLALPALAQDRRVALVIGNSTYKNAPALPNTVNDARDTAEALRKLGFEVVDGLDLDKRGMDQALARFARLAQDADAVMFYYAGHGFQFNGENFLVPLEARIDDEVSVQYETLKLSEVITALGFAKGVKIMVLDACRNNPFVAQLSKKQATRGFSVGSGLAPIARAQGMVTAYATQANDVAADGAGRNSPFTAALVQEMRQPGLEIATMFRRVQKAVYDATGGRQTPELSLSLLGDFYLNREETDADIWKRLRSSDNPAEIKAFIHRFPASFFAVDAKTRLDLLERRNFATSERAKLESEFAAREKALLERVQQAEKSRQQAATDLAGRDAGKTDAERSLPRPADRPTQAPASASVPAAKPSDAGERERLAKELARREQELASLEAEKARLSQERQDREKAVAARISAGAAVKELPVPEKPLLPSARPTRQEARPVPPQERTVLDRRSTDVLLGGGEPPAPARASKNRRPNGARDCTEDLMRAQLGDGGGNALKGCR